MKERPILFSGEMVRAILEGRKTQTRRVVKGMALDALAPHMFTPEYVANPENSYCPYGNPGDQLWVRETWCKFGNGIIYRADYGSGFTPISDGIGGPWKPSIHMPRSASRLSLEITKIRVERVNDISMDDCFAEGIPSQGGNSSDGPTRMQMKFADLWDSLNEKRGFAWHTSPWVWVIEFQLGRYIQVERT